MLFKCRLHRLVLLFYKEKSDELIGFHDVGYCIGVGR